MMIKNTSVVVFIFTTLLLNTHNGMEGKSSYKTYLNQSGLFNKTFIDFTDTKNETVFEEWIEYSDTDQKSKATLLRFNGQVNIIYTCNSTDTMFRTTNQPFSSIHSTLD
ncbi:uncharacterized protein DC041_0007966 [Schistosoma bovis]|uniref:Lipocalin/cytosolic fatty-acid binding domain-containing protein n=1 Tax=Schistosoma bovis TaxID=6184 RepID=A0A430Q3Y8_SCHBO|nr:uncharacterized protein DC041_0007966 [Schistosoma bovis]